MLRWFYLVVFILVHVERLEVKEAVLQRLKHKHNALSSALMRSSSIQPITTHLPDALQTVEHREVEGAIPEGSVPEERDGRLMQS